MRKHSTAIVVLPCRRYQREAWVSNPRLSPFYKHTKMVSCCQLQYLHLVYLTVNQVTCTYPFALLGLQAGELLRNAIGRGHRHGGLGK